MKQFLQRILFFLSHRILRKYTPEVIGITGSMGKTSAREAIARVLESKYSVRQSLKNYNNEIGVPLAILGSESGNRSLVRWLGILLKGVGMLLMKRSFPDILVLEYGLDRPGDISYLVKLARPNIAVVTAIGDVPVHVEYFKSRDALIREKTEIVTKLTKDDTAVLNADDPLVLAMARKTKANVVTYGNSPRADVRATGMTFKGLKQGMHMKILYKGTTLPVVLPHLLGEHQLYPVLAAVAVGLVKGMNLVDIADALSKYRPPAGRMNIIPGIKHTTIIDDSYNASPPAALAALDALQNVTTEARKIAVLGDMSELGQYTEESHARVGEHAAEVADILVTVGAKARVMETAAETQGMSRDHMFAFDDSEKAGLFLQDHIEKGDILLVKGSESVRMEKIVKELMAEPLRAGELLIRQGSRWQKK